MSGVLGWVKKNLIIVIAVVLILVFLPVGWVFSSGWNQRVKNAATQAYNSTRGELDRAGSVTYSLPAVLEGEQPISESRAPNRRVTEFFQQQKDMRVAQVEDVVRRGTAFNRGDHAELVPGLLPRAANNSALRLLGLEMAEQIAGTRDSAGNVIRPSVYDQLLRRLNAGGPPDPAELGGVLAEFGTRERERFSAGSTDGRLTDAQNREIGEVMVRRRLQEYAGRARSLNFYASIDALRGGQGDTGWSRIPSVPPSQSEITEARAFVWLWDYWVITDVLEAVALANTDPISGSMTVPDAPIKRVERLRIAAVDLPAAGGADAGAQDDFGSFGGRDAYAGGDPYGSPTGAAPTGPVSHTGRTGDDAYDIRRVELTVIASSRDLPRLFEALGRVNYMTVTGVQVDPVDVWAHLESGYFYGDDHVVRATIDIETVWLRSWTLPLMPDRVRQALGAPVDAPAGAGDTGFDDGP
ncbi:MAG: hypothetical protein LAT64_10825 [Phycisphaerales bacterium]|nr:hypothetical protein [Planctomycetota bacterium]MCH8509243.1 hypothetical protein [Phycisphaerales bacterium]